MDQPSLAVEVSYLRLQRPLEPKQPKPLPHLFPCREHQAIIFESWKPDIHQYRKLYRRVGERYLWWERLAMDDQALDAILNASTTALYLLRCGQEQIGFAELHHRVAPGISDIAFFGLVEGQTDRGRGGRMMEEILAAAWWHSSRPEVVTVNTCTLDHPQALGFYQHRGFRVVRTEQKTIKDPRMISGLYAHQDI